LRDFVMTQSAEVIVVGAGPAGLSLALQLGGAGRSVLLIDKADAPRDKVCGEGLMPLGMAALREIGIAPESLPGHDFHGLDYRSFRQGHRLSFAPGVRGRGIRRTVLIGALQRAALACPGVSLCKDEVLEPLGEDGVIRGVRGRAGSYQARMVIAADGVHSALARAAGIRRKEYGYRMGLRRHYRVAARDDWERVKVGLFAPYDVYLTPVGDDTVLATTMTTRTGYDAAKTDYEGFLAGTPFAEWFRGAEPVSPLLGWHHPLCTYEGRAVRGMLLVGDAGGSLDPCLGLGISMALHTSRLACEAVLGALERPAEASARVGGYARASRALIRHYLLFDSLFRLMVVSKARGEILLWGMRHWPETADAILGIVAERRPWGTFSWRSLVFPRRGPAQH
jgi:flavin-dependent dehydrogenase